MVVFSNFIAPSPQSYRQQYDRYGCVLVRNVFDHSETAKIRECFTSQVESEDHSLNQDDGLADDDILKRYPRFIHPHRHPETRAGVMAKEYMLDPRLFSIVEVLVGPAYAAQSMFYFKPPTARGQALHQDNWFLQSHPETCLAAWVAIDDADPGNGGLRVVPGTHEQLIICHEPSDKTVSFSRDAVPELPKGSEVVEMTMKQGDVLFFNGSLVHGSLPNTSKDRFRRAIIFHYTPQASRMIAKQYQPLVSKQGDEVRIDQSPDGKTCGEGWAE